MDYRMIARDSGWKVYDVLVDGVSLVVNYRSLFGSTVDRSGIDGLIRLLRDKNAAGTTG
jgi:phospholipid transport system substrate-binding protein